MLSALGHWTDRCPAAANIILRCEAAQTYLHNIHPAIAQLPFPVLLAYASSSSFFSVVPGLRFSLKFEARICNQRMPPFALSLAAASMMMQRARAPRSA